MNAAVVARDGVKWKDNSKPHMVESNALPGQASHRHGWDYQAGATGPGMNTDSADEATEVLAPLGQGHSALPSRAARACPLPCAVKKRGKMWSVAFVLLIAMGIMSQETAAPQRTGLHSLRM